MLIRKQIYLLLCLEKLKMLNEYTWRLNEYNNIFDILNQNVWTRDCG